MASVPSSSSSARMAIGMTEVQKQRAENMWMSGSTIQEIADALGFQYSTITDLMYRNRDRFPRMHDRVIRKPRGYEPLLRPLTTHELWVFKRMWHKGFLLSDIADSLGFAYTYLLGIVRECPEDFPKRDPFRRLPTTAIGEYRRAEA